MKTNIDSEKEIRSSFERVRERLKIQAEILRNNMRINLAAGESRQAEFEGEQIADLELARDALIYK